MSKIASAKQTGQGGTSYEDKVNAYFMACMLSETPPFNKSFGLIEKIEFQVKADGWLFDDTLLTMNVSGIEKRVAVSSKSGQQFNTNGCPVGITYMLWQQYLHDTSTIFKRNSDYLCKVEPPLSPAVSNDLDTILNQAYQQEAATFHSRNSVDGYNSKARRKIYESFFCPSDLADKYSIPKEATGDLLKHFVHHRMDFESVNSQSEQLTLKLCQAILKHKQFDTAVNLYETLVVLPREFAPVSGFLNREKLVKKLRGRYELNDFPSLQSDWNRLEEHSVSKLNLIQETIGGTITLNRTNYSEKIIELGQKANCVFVTGISGSGKTVISKKLAVNLRMTNRVIWLDSGDFEMTSVENELRLQHSLSELMLHNTTTPAYLFIDGPEKLYAINQQKRLASVLKTIFDNPDNGWKVIFTTPSDSFNSFLSVLNGCNINLKEFQQLPVSDLDDEDAELLAKDFPAIFPFLYDVKIRPVLSNLKLLDKLMFHFSKIQYPQGEFAGESFLIDFIWRNEIESSDNGFQKALFLKNFAEKQADTLALTVSQAEFSIAEAEPANALVKSGLLNNQHERLSFSHDLYGDWARYRLLLSQADRLSDYLKTKHLASPLWARAVRLFGISVLEKDSELDSWKSLIKDYNSKTAEHVIIQNLLLEALFFANCSIEYLEKNKQFLFDNNGEYFLRLLLLFITKATKVNPEIIRIANEVGISPLHALEIDRIPEYQYWNDMLKFLHGNIETILSFGWENISSIVNTWIKKTPSWFPQRKEAVDINIRIANSIINKRSYLDDKLKKPVFETLLLGYNETPENTKEICLKLCRRLEIKPAENTTNETLNIEAPPSIMDMLSYTKREAVQWEDGPSDSVDSSFQSVCLETHYLATIIINNPQLATEILLAVLIDEPEQKYLGTSSYTDDYSIHEPLQWSPPFYLRGPFLNFLRLSPVEAIMFTIKITDFATARWLEEDRERNKIEQGIVVKYNGINKNYNGDQSVFCWHKDIGNAPHSLVSILMAFEQFLYEELEKEKPINQYVELAIYNTNSLAIVGLLLVVAKISPDLYTSELKHLLPVSIFYKWDLHSQYHDNFSMWHDFPKSWLKQAEDWKKRQHRFFPLKDAVLNHFLFSEDLQKIFEPITEYWTEELVKEEAAGYEDVYLLQMIPQFKIRNFDFIKKEDKTEVSYREPDEVKKRLEEGRRQSLTIMNEGNFAFRCDQIISEKKTISEGEANQIWSKIQSLIAGLNTNAEDDEHDLNLWASPYTNILAGMALLIHSKDSWMEGHPDYYDTIKIFILDLLNNQTEKARKFPENGTHNDWNIFLAMLAPQLWKSDLENKDLRKLMAGVYVLFNNATIKKLFENLANLFTWDDKAFVQMQNFAITYSAAEYSFYNSGIRDELKLHSLKIDLINAFGERNLPKTPLAWSAVRANEKWRPKETRSWRKKENDDFIRPPGIATMQIKEMLACLPALNNARNSAERGQIIYLWHEAFKQVIYELGEIKEASESIDDFPDEFNLLVIQKIAEMLTLLNDDERVERFWKPLFEFGYIAQRWIERFCTYYFLTNVEKTERHDKMIVLLREMLEFTNNLSTWSTKHINSHEDFRLCIVGMQRTMLNIWGDDLNAFTNKAQEIYKKWFLKNKINHHAVLSLLDFCTRKSGEFIFKEALMILKIFFGMGEIMERQETPKGYVLVGHPEHDSKLAIALATIWEKQKTFLKKEGVYFKIFKDLVQYSVSKNNQVAIDLQAKLVF